MPDFHISDDLFRRLQDHAVPLVDTLEDVVARAVDALDRGNGRGPVPVPSGPAPSSSDLVSYVGRVPHGTSLRMVYKGVEYFADVSDGKVVWNGKRWSAQWKTYTDDLLSLQERVRLSFHEVGYQWLAESEGIPWGGTILGACQKLPGYRIIDHRRHEITDQDRVEAFSIHYLTRPPEMQERMVRDLLAAAEKTQWELEGMHIRRNYDSCFGPYGRGKCPYFAVCHESEDLMGPKFKDLEDRYGNDDSSVQKAVEP